MTNGLLLLLALGALAYLISTKQPGAWRLCGAFLAAGVPALGIVWARREAALPGTRAARSWVDEMVVGGDPAIVSANPFHAVAGGIVWLLFWALFLYDEDSRERGPWVLALLPLLIVVPMMVMRPLGAEGAGSPLPGRTGSILALVFAIYVIGLAAYWYVRRRA